MQMFGNEYKELLENGDVLLFARNGIFQARVYAGDRRYVYRSLKTTHLEDARKLALRFLHETEFKRQEGMPLQQMTLAAVIDEYIALRQRQYKQSQTTQVNSSTQQRTSISMLRQIIRVSKFWREYCGKTAVERIDDACLQDYVGWRKDYYHNKPPNEVPRNAKLNPADKTIEWEITYAKMLLKYAHERGYRGKNQLPKYLFKASRKIVRPAFSTAEYRQIYKRMRRWIYETDNDTWRYTRLLLRDYVLFLANTGMRVGEANNLLESDVSVFFDEHKRKNYRIEVKGKTGKRVVVGRTGVVRYIERAIQRNAEWKERWEDAKKAAANRKTEDKNKWLFRMADGNKIITLIDQFNVVLKSINLTTNRYSEKYTLYCLRHFYATQMLERRKAEIFDIGINMGTSVKIIQEYYANSANTMRMAGRLGG